MSKIDLNGDGEGDVGKGLIKLGIGLIFKPEETLEKVDNILLDLVRLVISIILFLLYIVVSIVILFKAHQLGLEHGYFMRFIIYMAGGLLQYALTYFAVAWVRENVDFLELGIVLIFMTFGCTPFFLLAANIDKGAFLMTVTTIIGIFTFFLGYTYLGMSKKEEENT